MPPGQSLHEAGLAVDIAGIAGKSGRRRYVTTRGRRIVRIMEKNGFDWRYGLADPAHFEIAPQRVGYRSVKHAIKRSQSTCQVRLASARKPRPATRSISTPRTRQAPRVTSVRVHAAKAEQGTRPGVAANPKSTA
jgi:hypothetical protein